MQTSTSKTSGLLQLVIKVSERVKRGTWLCHVGIEKWYTAIWKRSFWVIIVGIASSLIIRVVTTVILVTI